MRKLGSIMATALALSALLAGCNTSGCLENRNSVPLAGFYASGSGKSIAVDSLQITGEGMPDDDPLLDAGSRRSQVYLPMRSTQQTTSWVLSYKQKALDDPRLNDTISFAYDSAPYFASSECGVIFRYRITNVAHTCHLLDSVVMADSLITNVDIEQIKIYFKVAEEPDE